VVQKPRVRGTKDIVELLGEKNQLGCKHGLSFHRLVRHLGKGDERVVRGNGGGGPEIKGDRNLL